MADYKKIDLQIGTEEQFEEKKLSLPVGTLVGITDPIHESELDTDLQTKINEVSNKLTAPTTPTADSAVTMAADGTVGTKPLTSIAGKSEVYVGSTTPTNPGEILWIDPNGTSGGGSSGGGNTKLYRHVTSTTQGTIQCNFITYSTNQFSYTDAIVQNLLTNKQYPCYFYSPVNGDGIGYITYASGAGFVFGALLQRLGATNYLYENHNTLSFNDTAIEV